MNQTKKAKVALVNSPHHEGDYRHPIFPPLGLAYLAAVLDQNGYEVKVLDCPACHLTHENLKVNPWAAYLFIEKGEGWTGKRLYLKKVKEEQNDQLIGEICRRCDYSRYDVKNRHIVYFSVEKVLPLIGTNEPV